MFFLLVRDGGREPATRIEAANGMDIGRAPDNQCLLADPNVGRKAARIVEDRGKLYVEDLGSTNRTGIRGGRKLAKGERELLRHGLVIEVGRSWIEIEEERVSPDDRTNPGDATGAGDETGTNFGEQTIVAPPSGDGPRAPNVRPPLEPEFVETIQARRPAPGPVAPAPRRGEPAPAPARGARAPAPPPVERPPTAVPTDPPAPQPVPVERSASASSTSDFMGAGGIGSGTQSIRPISGDLGAIGTLITRRARLVIVNEALRRIDPIVKQATLIGRESGECRIDHKAISQPHAMIRFVDATMNFQIEDRKSKNQTFVGQLALNPDVPQLLAPECLIRFGPIEAVFVVDRDSENVVIPPADYAAALRYLLSQNLVTQEQARAAQEEAKKGERHVGEALMMAGVVSAKIWTKAFENGKFMAGKESSSTGGNRTKLLIAIGVVIVLVVLAFVFKDKLGFGAN